MLAIALSGVVFALGVGLLVSIAQWRGAERRARQLLETISVSSYHNDEFRKIAKRERKDAALKALGELLP